jgi:DNA polymerase III delta prime subunit|tara:strand:- start:1135 stop:2079 length:945 start_codon:yes stop_codon:yes gene_type:complete
MSISQMSKPWVEKYRPTKFDDIVLDPLNKVIMENILRKNYFPNLLLYGPPGTGKTTTIMNLVDTYQENNDQRNKGLMIHLNASDERGIDIIRNQINQFINSQTLFNSGTKFVILDEVDYMTKNAQYALKYLLQGFNRNVRFCLICNYISRIDETLQNEFTRLRFNQLPQDDIIKFLSVISEKEKLSFSDDTLVSIQRLYKSDIRSMINYMQSNQDMIHNQQVIDMDVWESLTSIICDDVTYMKACTRLDDISQEYNIEIKNIIKDYLNYIIRYRTENISPEFLKFVEFIMHLHDSRVEYVKNYAVISLHNLLVS